MSDKKTMIEADPRALDLAHHLLAVNEARINSVEMFTWMAKAHFVEDSKGQKSRLILAGNGEYELARMDSSGRYTNKPESGHIDMTPQGKPAMVQAQELGRRLTGQDLDVKSWIDFSGFASGRILTPVDKTADHSFVLLELGDDHFGIVRGDNPSEGMPTFDREPFAEGSISRSSDTEVYFTCCINILDAGEFAEAMGVEDIDKITFRDLEEKMLNVDVTLEKAGLKEIQCSDIEISGLEMRFKVMGHVEDHAALTREARECYAGCWGDTDWYPKSAADALWELSLASNGNPSPDDFGFEFIAMLEEPDPVEGEPDDTPEI
jgi:hypothetical protein